jgi:hypothetical protein
MHKFNKQSAEIVQSYKGPYGGDRYNNKAYSLPSAPLRERVVLVWSSLEGETCQKRCQRQTANVIKRHDFMRWEKEDSFLENKIAATFLPLTLLLDFQALYTRSWLLRPLHSRFLLKSGSV